MSDHKSVPSERGSFPPQSAHSGHPTVFHPDAPGSQPYLTAPGTLPKDAVAQPPAATSAPPRPSCARALAGEFLGTCVLVLIGCGSLAQTLLSRGEAGTYASVAGAWGAALALGVLVAGPSGGHLNPAVTLALTLFRSFSWRRAPLYMLAQFFGALVAAALLWGNYQSAIHAFEGGDGILTVPPAPNATAGVFATYPTPFMTKAGQFYSEIFATGLLVFLIFAITDAHNPLGMGRFAPVGLFFVFWAITASFGWETGFAVNPARDFGPRLLTSMVGYGRRVWTADQAYFLVPLFGPFIGAVFGGFFYDLFLYRGDDSWVARLVQRFGRRPQHKEAGYPSTV